jgi:hypothetical protein
VASYLSWFQHRVLRSPWHRADAIVARSIGLAAWVSLASWQLAGAKPPQASNAIVIALFAAESAIGIGLASGYQWRAARSLDMGDVAPNVEVLAA